MKKRIQKLVVGVLLTTVLTTSAVAQSKIYEFPFDNSYAATVGTGTFTANDSTSFVIDRHGNTNGALNIVNTGCDATLTGLPYGTASRSVALWVNINQHDQNTIGGLYNMLFKYGTSSQSNAFSGSAGLSTVYLMSYDDNILVYNPTDTAEWNHFVFSFNESGSAAKIYKNGVEILSGTMPSLNTINDNDLFRLGTGPGNEFWFNGAIDDLQIYNYALSASEVALLHNPSFSTNDISLKNIMSIYPNPTKNVLNIETSEKTNIKIVNILGAIVTTQNLQTGNNTIDVSTLTNGVYFIQTANGGAVKFIKE